MKMKMKKNNNKLDQYIINIKHNYKTNNEI